MHTCSGTGTAHKHAGPHVPPVPWVSCAWVSHLQGTPLYRSKPSRAALVLGHTFLTPALHLEGWGGGDKHQHQNKRQLHLLDLFDMPYGSGTTKGRREQGGKDGEDGGEPRGVTLDPAGHQTSQAKPNTIKTNPTPMKAVHTK